jgi:hypothetical protein
MRHGPLLYLLWKAGEVYRVQAAEDKRKEGEEAGYGVFGCLREYAAL